MTPIEIETSFGVVATSERALADAVRHLLAELAATPEADEATVG